MQRLTAAVFLLAMTAIVIGQEPKGKVVEAFYQEVDVHRRPNFNIQGLPIAQNVRYRIRSLFTLYEPDGRGVQIATQEIRETELVEADALSQSIFPGSLAELKGKTMTYTLDSFGEVMQFSGFTNKEKPIDLKSPGLQGALITNVIDEDGWKELARLTLFRPPTDEKPRATFQFHTEHDWGSLGGWYGRTEVRRGSVKGNIRQYLFKHHLEYTKPGDDKGNSPLVIKAAKFDLYRAEGEIRYDTRSRRVSGVREFFSVRGNVETELLGSKVTVGLEEDQVMTITVNADTFELRKDRN